MAATIGQVVGGLCKAVEDHGGITTDVDATTSYKLFSGPTPAWV